MSGCALAALVALDAVPHPVERGPAGDTDPDRARDRALDGEG